MTETTRSRLDALSLPAVVALAVGIGVVYAIGARLTFWFVETPANGVAFFPSAGITFGALVVTPRRVWPYIIAAVGIAELSVDMSQGQAFTLALAFALANTIEPVVGAHVLRATGGHIDSSRRRLLLYFGCAALAPIFGAFIGATASATIGTSANWFSTFGSWWLGDALGILAVATPIMVFARPSETRDPAGASEIATITIIATALVVVPCVLWDRPVFFVVLLPLIWAALRGGCRAVSIVGFTVSFATAWVVATGHADQLLADASAHDQLVYMQLFLLVTLVAMLTLAVEVAERQRAERNAVRSAAAHARAELDVMEAAANERQRIVRESHDILGHALTAMLLQAGAARRVSPTNAVKTRALLESIEATGRDAFRDLDVALGLADEPRDLFPSPGLAELRNLLDNMRRGGLDIDFEVTGDELPLPRLVDCSAYRIFQEAITNVAKHAPQSRATVALAYEPSGILINVTNVVAGNGNGSNGNGNGSRRGLVGLRERVTVLGGEMDAGATDDGRFVVRGQASGLMAIDVGTAIRVLIVDDDVPTRIGLQTIVAAEPDMEVVGEGATGTEACDLAAALDPDVVLMDVRMQGTDGIAATRRITSDQEPHGHTTRVIVVTTYDIDDYVYRSIEAGASGFLLKRSTPEELLDAIRLVAQGEALPSSHATRRLIEQYAAEPGEMREPAQSVLEGLTKRELEVLTLVGKGRSNTEIGEELFLSVETVKSHVKHVYTKTGARDRAQLVIIAYRTGLVPREGE